MYWDEDDAHDEYDRETWDLWKELGECRSNWEGTYRAYWGIGAEQCPDHLTIQQWKQHVAPTN